MRVLMICPELPSVATPGSMAPGARQIESIRGLGIETHVVDMYGGSKLKYLRVIPKIRRLTKQVDLIHAHFGYCGWLAKLAPALMRPTKPIVMSFMGDDLLGSPHNAEGDLEWLSRVMVRCNKYLAGHVSSVIVKSQEMANVIAPVPCTIIPNGVDIDVFCPSDRVAACQQIGIDPAAYNVLFPGDPENPRKGHKLAAEAVVLAQEIVGQQINLLPLWGVRPDQVAVYMNACQAMLMTSLIEGSPNVVKEAMACNLPVVGVPVGDVHELLDGVNGCSCCRRDAQELGNAVAASLTDNERSKGREAVLDRKLDLVSVAEQIAKVYSDIL